MKNMSEGHFELPREGELEEQKGEAQAERKLSPELFFTKAAAESRASELHPDRNEDAFFADAKRGAFGVFDGVGGEAGGREAAELVRDYVAGRVEDEFPEGLPLKEAEKRMRKLLEEANTLLIQERLLQKSGVHPERKEMGTTATVVKLLRDKKEGEKAVIGHVGDSRAYRFRNGMLEALTLDDHAAIEALSRSERDRRALQETLGSVTDAAALEQNANLKFVFENRHMISGVLGGKGTEPHVYAANVQAGDVLLISSDGIHDNLTDREIAETFTRETDPQRAADVLVAAAKERSRDRNHIRAKPDDMTAVVVAWPESKHIG